MKAFQSLAYGLSCFCAALAALAIILMTGHILLEIVLRSFFSTSTFVLDEMVGYSIAAATFLSLGYAFEHSSLVRVGLLLERFHGVKKRVLESICAVVTFLAMGQITWYLIGSTLKSFQRGRVSSSLAEVPLWIPEAICTFGLVVFCIQVFAFWLRQFTGEPGPVTDGGHDAQNDL